jgi:outer membrane protein assembly factor BamB
VIFQSSVFRTLGRLTLFAAALAILAACSGPQKAKPMELGANTALLGIRPVWSSSIGSIGFPLQVKSSGNEIYVAASDGVVAAIDIRTGGDVWRTSLGTSLSAGVGADGRYVSVVSQDNEVITLVAGKVIWRQKIPALTLTAPFVAGERVFVVSTDRTVTAFDAASGQKLWQQQRNGDALILGQAGLLLAVGDTLVVGLSGRLVGLNPQNGNIRWDLAVASSRGTNEIERLVDIVAGSSRAGDNICVRAFQSAIGCVNASTGRLLWTKPAAGSTGLHGDDALLVGTERDGRIQTWKISTGERDWASERLRYRSLSAALMVGRSVVIGDDSGNLHFLSRLDGEPLNRMSTDGSSIVTTPVLAGQTVVAVTQRGGIFGFRPE